MQFSPKKDEIYISKLRNIIHTSLLKNGVSQKNLVQIKKIELYNLLIRSKTTSPTDTFLFLSIALYSAQALLLNRGLNFALKIRGGSINIVDRKALVATVCEICLLAGKEDGAITVVCSDTGIRIFYRGSSPNKTLKRLIKKQDGILFKIFSKDVFLIFLPQKQTQMKSEKITGAVSLLTDPLSTVNIFTSKLLN